ncbi:putative DNA binding protein [uncultured Mediterranean phage uvMED]|nr:putative DNA binding protein [uncultured Mediterranean phage uvMED]
MRNGKYKAFYVSNEQHDEINDILKKCQDLTLKQINELYPATRKVIINITEKDIMILALKKYLEKLQSK